MATRSSVTNRQLLRDFGVSLYTGSGRITSASSVFDPTTTDFTACVWMKRKMGAAGTVISQVDGTGTGRSWLQISGTGFVQSLLGNVTHTGTIPILSNQWTHVAVTKTGTTISLYVNGVLDVTYTVTVESASGALKIASDKNNATILSGNVCDVQIYQSLLSATDIANLYATGLQPSTPYLWYKFTDGQGTSVTDFSSNANSGIVTIGNGSWSLDVPTAPRLYVRDFGTSMFNPQTTSFAYSSSADFNPAGSMSMGAWVKRAKLASGTYVIIGKGKFIAGATNATYSLGINSNHQPVLRLSKDGSTVTAVLASMTVQNNNWHHIAVTYQDLTDGTSVGTIYLNGQQVGLATNCPAPLFSSSADFGVSSDFTGAGHATTGSPFSGFIDEAFYYNNVLSQAQVKDLMRYGTRSSLVPMNDTNLYGFWTFNEATGTTAADSSVRGNNLTVNVSTSWSPDVVMKSRPLARDFKTSGFFNGFDNGIDLGTPSGLAFERTDSFTISAWIKSKGSVSAYEIFGKRTATGSTPGYSFLINASTKLLRISLANVGGGNNIIKDGSIIVGDNKWHHALFTYDGSSTAAGVKIYLDGVLDSGAVNTQDNLSSSMLTTSHAAIGYRDPTGTSNAFFGGNIDEVAVWNKALSQAEITLLYAGNPPFLIAPATLKGYWTFDEGSGTSLFDTSGNAITGTWKGSLGSQWSTDVPMKARSLT